MRRNTFSRKGAKEQKTEGTKNALNGFLCALRFNLFAPLREISLLRPLVTTLFLISLTSCAADQKLLGIPPEAQATIDMVTADFTASRDDKIYQEAAEEWRQAVTLEQTREFFKSLRAKLGGVKNRAFHTARGEQNTGGTQPGQSFIIQYQTTFERGEGMETFTLVERDARWQLARYFVNSEALKQ